MQQLVRHAKKLLSENTSQASLNSSRLFWPGLIVLCAILEEDEFNEICKIGERLFKILRFSRYWRQAIQTVKEQRRAVPCEVSEQCDGYHDGSNIFFGQMGYVTVVFISNDAGEDN